jgi:predicted ribosomally synthesized peptide with SipW-like signal peptide
MMRRRGYALSALVESKMTVSRRVLFSILGLGIVGILGSAGTFAAFTASSFNPMNDFNSATLLMTDTTGFTSAATTLNKAGIGPRAPNQTGTDPRTLAECATAVVAAQCSTLIKSVRIAASGIEPGQYVQGTITISNAGSIPATLAMQIQNLQTNNGNNSLYATGAAGFRPCGHDAAGAAAPGATGAQIPSGANTGTSYAGAAVPLAGCLDLGRALRITVQDAGANGTGPQCVFGNDTTGAGNGNDVLQAPASGAFGAGGGFVVYAATGFKLGSGSGSCDDLSQPSTLGRPNSPVLPGSNPKDTFGTQTDAASNASFAGISGAASLVFIPGGSPQTSIVNTPELGGDLRSVPQWASSEAHTLTITLALPNTGQTLITDHNNDKYNVGNDDAYQGGAVSFDLYWFAIQ